MSLISLPDRSSPTRRCFLKLIAGTVAVVALPEESALGQAQSSQHRLVALSEEDALGLLAIVRRIVPLAGTDESVYLAIVAGFDTAAQRDPDTAKLLKSGLLAARGALSGNLDRIPGAELDRYLRSIETQPFFRYLYSTTVPAFFGNASVWQQIGYEGESFSKGGYLQRGFNDLAWLPEPPGAVQGPLPF